MTGRVLCVDDDPSIRVLVQAQLEPAVPVDTAESAEQALDLVAAHGPYAVVLSDMRMAGMNGVELLARLRETEPETVRILFTAYADLATALDAVNSGNVFRLVTKPFAAKDLFNAVQAGLEQHGLLAARRELLEKTLSGTIKVLAEVLSIVDPNAFGRGLKLRDSMRALAEDAGAENAWELELAAMLSQLGQVGIPPELAARASAGKPLSPEEQEIAGRAPELSFRLLQNIPRLESVARMIRYQSKCFDGTGPPADGVRGADVPLGGRMLKILLDLSAREARGVPRSMALLQMRSRQGGYDPALLALVERRSRAESHRSTIAPERIPLSVLRDGHVLVEDIETSDGTLLLAAGSRITIALLERIRNHARLHPVREPVVVSR